MTAILKNPVTNAMNEAITDVLRSAIRFDHAKQPYIYSAEHTLFGIKLLIKLHAEPKWNALHFRPATDFRFTSLDLLPFFFIPAYILSAPEL